MVAPNAPFPARVLGIDPGTHFFGWAVTEIAKPVPRVLGGGVFVPQADKSKPGRLAEIDEELEKIIKVFKPATASLEAGFIYPGRIQGVLTLSECRGVVIVGLMRRGIPVHEYSPSEIKKATTGKGDADKDTVRHAVRAIFGLAAVPAEDHADALATAWIHLGRIETSPALERVDAEITRQMNREWQKTGPKRKRYDLAPRSKKGGEVD